MHESISNHKNNRYSFKTRLRFFFSMYVIYVVMVCCIWRIISIVANPVFSSKFLSSTYVQCEYSRYKNIIFISTIEFYNCKTSSLHTNTFYLVFIYTYIYITFNKLLALAIWRLLLLLLQIFDQHAIYAYMCVYITNIHVFIFICTSIYIYCAYTFVC